ncbi:hypothetical protein, partial [Paenibacillus sp. VT-400]|uniref:hypothetical protein n=1 Tax=Paenibacillus sp. VT-400 TaxID=1495853 RepID=UPI001F34BA83
QPEHASRFPPALLLVENEIANRRVNLHSEHPRQPRKGSAYPMADFYAARAGTNAGAPLDGFLTAVHMQRRKKSKKGKGWSLTILLAFFIFRT